MNIWDCKIGETVDLPQGADFPMRMAVTEAYRKVTGKEPAFLFSGWGASLSEDERAVVENRLPERSKAPSWHDAPTVPGLWVNSCDGFGSYVMQHHIDSGSSAKAAGKWYGPIPQEETR